VPVEQLSVVSKKPTLTAYLWPPAEDN